MRSRVMQDEKARQACPTPPQPRAHRVRGVAARMGGWSASHWKTAVAAWFAFVLVAVMAGGMIGTKSIDQNDATVGESRTADHMLADAGFALDDEGNSAEAVSQMVLIRSTTLTADQPAFQTVIEDAVQTVGTFEQVTDVEAPLGGQHDDLVSADGHAVLVGFTPKGTYDDVKLYIDDITAAVDGVASRHADLSVESLGASTDKELDEAIQGGLAKAGLISIPLTILILLFVMRSLVAVAIPLVLSLSSIIATSGLIAFSSRLVPASEQIMEVVLLVGLAVGVDYSLFYIRRAREERAAGRNEGAALAAAAATSGRAVLISGITVLIAMAGMFLSGDETFMSFSVGTMIVVAVAMLASLTVLPAILSRLGGGVDRVKVPFLAGPRRTGTDSRIWGAVLQRVLRRPVTAAVLSGAVLVALALPTLQLHTTQTGLEGITSSAVDPFAHYLEAFPGAPQPAEVAIEADDVNAPAVQQAIVQLEQQALASGQMNTPVTVDVNPGHTVAHISVPLQGNGVDGQSIDALATLRNDLLPATVGQLDGVDYAVTGVTANTVDFNDAQKSSAPKVFGFVLLFAFGLLLVSFRSLVIAVKAIILNLLSVAAAYGVLVLTFQKGWGEGLIGFQSNGGIANWLPVFMFVILFGLSMDYHVFILSRIRESYDGGRTSDEAIAHGIRSTAGVVTSAAVVMVGVFMVFTTLPLIDLKEMGVGLAAAVLIDATIVRGVLLPASMKLLGDANWYLPRWLEWLPRLDHGASPATHEHRPDRTPVALPEPA